jgi:flagellar basal body-associated protein FliL
MQLLSQNSTIILIILMILLAVTLVIGIAAMGSQRFGPASRNKVARAPGAAWTCRPGDRPVNPVGHMRKVP